MSLFQSLSKKSLLLGCPVIWLTIICMRNYNLHTENFTALKQHWHVYMMKYWGQLMTTKVYYLLCSIMSVAFDTIDHDVLLSYFKSYLSGRPVCRDQWHLVKTNSISMWCTSRICTWSNSIHYLHVAFGWHNQEAWDVVSHVCGWLSIIHHFRSIWHQSDSFEYGNFDWWHPWLVLG